LTIWIADAHRGDGKRYVVRADEKLTAFLVLGHGRDHQGLGICFRKSNRNVSVADVQQGLNLKIIFRYFERFER
jgi:hypothetical protein